MAVYHHCRLKTVVWIFIFVLAIATCAGSKVATAQQTIAKAQSLELNAGSTLVIASSRPSIQRILIEGNLSYAGLTKPAEYPADQFKISASSPATYTIQIMFNNIQDYTVNIIIQPFNNSATASNSTYYISSGPFELDLNLVFISPPNAPIEPQVTMPPLQNFSSWLQKFGQAFPAWVKLVYMIFGVQFFAIGGLWIKREIVRKDTAVQHFDVGDKMFLWVDVAYKFLLACFLAIVAIMGGEVLVLFVLRFMFLVSLDLLSLWDLFVVCFAAGVVVIAYIIRLTLEKAFDLKPMEGEQ